MHRNVLICLLLCSITCIYSFNPTNYYRNDIKTDSKHHHSTISHASTLHMSGYIPPERDQEYRKMIKKSLLQPIATALNTNITSDNNLNSTAIADMSLPIPKEGDIVLLPGKWKNENILGRIRYMRLSDNQLMVEVIPLKEGKSYAVYTIDRNEKSYTENVDKLKPVRAFFLRSENGYKIAYRKNTTDIILRAPSYRVVDENFNLPIKEVSVKILEEDLKKYNELKNRMVINTLKFGAVGSVFTLLAFGYDAAFNYVLGDIFAAFYLILLGKKVDGIGAGFTANPSIVTRSKLDEILAKGRFLVPLLLVTVIAAKNTLIDDRINTQFNTMSKEQFLAAMAGFLTYRVSLLSTEVGVSSDDLMSFAPGSFAEGLRQSKAFNKDKNGGKDDSTSIPLKTVVLVTGPYAAGRSLITSSLISKDNTNVKQLKLLTTDIPAWQKSPEKYELISTEDYEMLRKQNSLIYDGLERKILSSPITVGLTMAGLEGAIVSSSSSSLVIDGPPPLLEALSKIPSLRLINIWISLQTKEQFIEKASTIVQEEAFKLAQKTGDKASVAAKSATEVSTLVNEAAGDITFYMQKAPLFEYTLLNYG